MLIKTRDKWEAAEAFINTWLKDKSVYCNNCGIPYMPQDKDKNGKWIPCCETPEIGTNWDFAKQIIDDNKKVRQTRFNKHASNKEKNWRMSVRIPPKLYSDLKNYFENNYHIKLFESNEDLRKFMRRFKAFCIPNKI